MKKPKSARVPAIEDAFALNLPELMRTAIATGASRLILDDGDVRTVAVLTQNRVAVFLGGRTWLVEVAHVRCLNGRLRPLLKCPRAHEGNFQSLYYWGSELACRQCLDLRYRSTLAPNAVYRERIARLKLLAKMGAEPEFTAPQRQPYKWRRRYLAMVNKLAQLNGAHYGEIRQWLKRLNDMNNLASHGK